MAIFKIKIEKVAVGERGGETVLAAEKITVKADDEKQAIRESRFIRTMRFIGGQFEERITVLGVS